MRSRRGRCRRKEGSALADAFAPLSLASVSFPRLRPYLELEPGVSHPGVILTPTPDLIFDGKTVL